MACMVSERSTTVSRLSAIPRAGPSWDDLVGASDKCHRDRQAKSHQLELGDQLDWGVGRISLLRMRSGPRSGSSLRNSASLPTVAGLLRPSGTLFAAQRGHGCGHGLREHSRDHRAYSAHLLAISTEMLVS